MIKLDMFVIYFEINALIIVTELMRNYGFGGDDNLIIRKFRICIDIHP